MAFNVVVLIPSSLVVGFELENVRPPAGAAALLIVRVEGTGAIGFP